MILFQSSSETIESISRTPNLSGVVIKTNHLREFRLAETMAQHVHVGDAINTIVEVD